MAVLSTLTIDLTANAAKLVSEVKRSDRKLKALAGSARRTGGVMAAALTAGAVAAAGGLAVLYSRTAENADRLAKFSDVLGVSTTDLVGFRHAAELGGVSSDSFDKAILKSSKSIGEAAHGYGTAKVELDRLGLSNQAFFDLAPARQFEVIADKIGGMSTQQEKAAAASAIFGRQGQQLLPTLQNGSAGLREMREEAELLNVAMSRADAAKFEAANDAVFRGKQALTGMGNTISTALAPLVTGLAESFTQAAKETGGFKTEVAAAMTIAIEMVADVADTVRGLEFAWAGVKAVALSSIAVPLEALAEMDRMITDTINKIPGVNETYYAGLQDSAAGVREMADAAWQDLDRVAAKGLPHDAIVNWAKEAQEKATAAAEAVAADRAGKMAGGDNVVDIAAMQIKADAALAVEQGKNNKLMQETFRLQGEQELAENLRFQSVLENQALEVDALREKGELSEEVEQSYRERAVILEQQHQIRLKQIHKKKLKDLSDLEKFQRLSFKNQTKQVLGELQGLTQGVAQHSKGMFRLNQMAGIANATVNTYEGVSESLGAYPMPLAGIMAAGHLVAGLAQVSAIKSATFGGSGASGSVAPSNIASGGAPVNGFTSNLAANDALSASDSNEERTPTQINIYVDGYVDSENMGEILKEVYDKDIVTFHSNSAQAQAIAA